MYETISEGTAINSILYGLKMGMARRRQLMEIVRRFHVPQLTVAVNPEELATQGVTVLVLDFDGVLAPHGDDAPLPEVEEWLRRCAVVLGEERIFILSNRPVPVRADYFHRVFPGIRFVSGVRKKPFPEGLLRIMELSGAVPGQVVMLDDRLLTGVLGACLAGVGVIYITAPYVSLAHRPLHESFFMLLRILERGFINLVSRLP
jgi:predicted HAD superfamily phosphohydrolase YqeG